MISAQKSWKFHENFHTSESHENWYNDVFGQTEHESGIIFIITIILSSLHPLLTPLPPLTSSPHHPFLIFLISPYLILSPSYLLFLLLLLSLLLLLFLCPGTNVSCSRNGSTGLQEVIKWLKVEMQLVMDSTLSTEARCGSSCSEVRERERERESD